MPSGLDKAREHAEAGVSLVPVAGEAISVRTRGRGEQYEEVGRLGKDLPDQRLAPLIARGNAVRGDPDVRAQLAQSAGKALRR